VANVGRQRQGVSLASTGKIGRLIGDRGFGFIVDDKGTELFFHATAVEGTTFDALHEGQQVTFERERDPRGRGDRAAHVKLVAL
jgi:CspA family cold shock protein